MGSTEWTLFLCCLGACICISQSSTCSPSQCVFDSVTAKADCSSLNLDCIPVNYPYAIIMDLSHNNISELSPDDFKPYSTFFRLAELYLDYNNISNVSSLLQSYDLPSLKKLSVMHNNISELPPCRLRSLTELLVDYNYIKYFNGLICGYDPISVSMQFNRLTNVWKSCCNCGNLILDHNEIETVRVSWCGQDLLTSDMHIMSISHNQLQSVYVDGNVGIFNVGSNGLSNWNNFSLFERYYHSHYLDISNNSFNALIQPRWAKGLKFLNADMNLLANLSSTTLSGFVDLTALHVANNRLLFISPTALSQLSMLQSLYLDNNSLTSLLGVFFNQSNLEELSITNNRLTMLHSDYFVGLLSLKRLYLAGNHLTSVNSQMLMPQILTLDLSRNELQLVDLQDCALNLTSLQDLSLAHNLIQDALTILGFCDNLQILDMSFNLIQVVPGESLSGRNKELSKLELEGNPLQCDCRLKGLRDWLRNNPPYVEPRCAEPSQNSGSLITDLDSHDFLCQQPMAIVDNQLTAPTGKSVSLTCTATGIPAPTITWLSPNNTEITHDWQGRFAILQGKILHITQVEDDDRGMYTCLAQNFLGEARAVVNLTVRPDSLASSILPTMFITIIITVAVIAGIIFLRRYRKKQRSRAANSTSATTTSDLKVGFRKGDTADSERGRVNEALDEDYEIPSEHQVQPYEDPSGGNREDKVDREVSYESVSGP